MLQLFTACKVHKKTCSDRKRQLIIALLVRVRLGVGNQQNQTPFLII